MAVKKIPVLQYHVLRSLTGICFTWSFWAGRGAYWRPHRWLDWFLWLWRRLAWSTAEETKNKHWIAATVVVGRSSIIIDAYKVASIIMIYRLWNWLSLKIRRDNLIIKLNDLQVVSFLAMKLSSKTLQNEVSVLEILENWMVFSNYGPAFRNHPKVCTSDIPMGY